MHRLVIVLSLALQVLPVAGGWPAQAAEIQIICDVEFVLPFVNSDYGARKAPVKPGWDKRQQGRGGSGRRLDLAKMGRVRDRVTLTGAGRQSNLSSNRLIIAERCARSVDRAHIVDVRILGDDVGAFGADSADPSGRLPELADGVLFSRRALPRPDWATLVGGIGAPRWPSSMTPNVVVPNNAPTPASADEVRDRLRALLSAPRRR
jgi:hypothetical protein